MVAGLVFDLDGTLIDSQRAYSIANQAALKLTNSSTDDFEAARLFVKKRLAPQHVSARNRWSYYKSMLEAMGRWSPNLLCEIMSTYETALVDDIKAQWRDLDRDRLFTDLTENFQMVIITNENLRGQILKISAMDPQGRFFQRIFTSEEFGVEKPDPSLLRAAIDHLKLKVSEICVIGDSFHDDVYPATQLGCKAVLTKEFANNPPGESESIGAHHLITKLSDLIHHV